MKDKAIEKDQEFPLDAYISVYNWIANWAEDSCDPEHRAVAQDAYESLTAVGVIIRDVMRQMNEEIEALERLPLPKTVN
jgi:hypothetical protein